jgi:hypothetical protein
METEINNLINKLDISTDILLIELLKQKLLKRYTYNPTFTDKEIKYAKQGLIMVVNNISKKERFNILKYKKATTILDNNSCDGRTEYRESHYPYTPCKYAIIERKKFTTNGIGNLYQFYVNNKSNPICISCQNRCKKLYTIIQDIEEKSYQFQDTLITKETIEVFAVINKIKNKLKEIKK